MNKNKSFVIAGLIILVILLLGAGAYYFSMVRKAPPQANNINSNTQPSHPDPTKLSYSCDSGESAFDALKKHISKVDSRKTQSGEFVISINGVDQGGGKYWIYSIDGKEATVSADTYICQGSERIDWQLK